MYSFRVCLTTRRLGTRARCERVIPAIFRAALVNEIAVIAQPLSPYHFRIVETCNRYFKSVATSRPEQIVGVYKFRGDPFALLDMLMEDLQEAALAGILA